MTTCYYIKYKCDESFKQITWYDMRNLTKEPSRYTVNDENVSYYCYERYIIKVIRR